MSLMIRPFFKLLVISGGNLIKNYPKNLKLNQISNSYQIIKFYTSSNGLLLDANSFEEICEETLSTLADYFEELIGNDPKLEKGDVSYGSGVLTIDLGNYGTYVINRQSPNKQIWLSSPTSGPKRFDFIVKDNRWIYKHNGETLEFILQKEFEIIVGKKLKIPIYYK